MEAREASEREARAAERQKAAEEQAVREAAHAQQLEAEKAKGRAAAQSLAERAAADRATAKKAEADRVAAEKRAAQLQSKLEAAAAAKLAEEEARATAANAAADKGRADPAAAKIKRLEEELRRASQALVDRDAASKAEREKALAEADEQRRETEDELNELRRASETSDDPLDDLAARVYEAFGSEKPSRSELKLLVSELKELKVEAFQGIALNAKTEVWEEALRAWYEARGAVRARSDAPSPAELRAEYADDAEVFVTLAGEVLVVEGIKDDVEVSGQPDTQITFADVNRRSVAIKSSERNLAREAYLLRELQSCPFVVRLEYEGFYLEKRVVALEWAEGNVLEAIGEYEDNLCGSSLMFGPVFALIEAMVHLHHMGIAFLDIKPANFLWFQTDGSLVMDRFKLCDPELAQRMDNDRLIDDGCCTAVYAPPLRQCSSFSGSKFDVYSKPCFRRASLTSLFTRATASSAFSFEAVQRLSLSTVFWRSASAFEIFCCNARICLSKSRVVAFDLPSDLEA